MQSEDCGMRKLILMKSLHWEEPWRIPYNPTLPLCKFSLLLFLKEIHFPLPCYFSENLPYISVKYFIRLKATKFLLWIFNIKKENLKKISPQKAEHNFLPVAPVTNSVSDIVGQLSKCKYQKLSKS